MRPIGRWNHKQVSFDQFVVGSIRRLRQRPKFFERVLPHQRREGHRTCGWSVYDLHRMFVKLDSNTVNIMSLGNANSITSLARATQSQPLARPISLLRRASPASRQSAATLLPFVTAV